MGNPLDGYVSTPEAARMLGVTPRRVGQLCQEGRLVEHRFGQFRLIEVASIRRYQATRRGSGSYRKRSPVYWSSLRQRRRKGGD